MKYVKVILRLFFLLFSLIIRRNKKQWIIGSWFGERYADNSKYLCDYLHFNNNHGITFFFVTKSEKIYNNLNDIGVPVIYYWSLKSIWLHLKSGVFIYDQSIYDINSIFSLGAVHINLWHGFPLKKIGCFTNNKKSKHSKYKDNIRDFIFKRKNNYILTTSELSTKILSNAFNIPERNCIKSVYPRNEYLLGNVFNYNKKYNIDGKKIIFYLPTFRDTTELCFLGTNNKKSIEKMTIELQAMGYVFITKVHAAEKNHNLLDLNDITNLINLDSNADIYSIVKETDILITDYSSIYFDFLMMNREVIFLPYDLDYYINNDRGILFDYDEYTPGVKIDNLNKIPLIVNKIETGEIDYSIQREALKHKIFEYGSMDSLINNIIKVMD